MPLGPIYQHQVSPFADRDFTAVIQSHSPRWTARHKRPQCRPIRTFLPVQAVDRRQHGGVVVVRCQGITQARPNHVTGSKRTDMAAATYRIRRSEDDQVTVCAGLLDRAHCHRELGRGCADGVIKSARFSLGVIVAQHRYTLGAGLCRHAFQRVHNVRPSVPDLVHQCLVVVVVQARPFRMLAIAFFEQCGVAQIHDLERRTMLKVALLYRSIGAAHRH